MRALRVSLALGRQNVSNMKRAAQHRARSLPDLKSFCRRDTSVHITVWAVALGRDARDARLVQLFSTRLLPPFGLFETLCVCFIYEAKTCSSYSPTSLSFKLCFKFVSFLPLFFCSLFFLIIFFVVFFRLCIWLFLFFFVSARGLRYGQLYEARINPFTQFSQKEKQRKYRELSVAEKITLNTTRMFLGNKFARWVHECVRA